MEPGERNHRVNFLILGLVLLLFKINGLLKKKPKQQQSSSTSSSSNRKKRKRLQTTATQINNNKSGNVSETKTDLKSTTKTAIIRMIPNTRSQQRSLSSTTTRLSTRTISSSSSDNNSTQVNQQSVNSRIRNSNSTKTSTRRKSTESSLLSSKQPSTRPKITKVLPAINNESTSININNNTTLRRSSRINSLINQKSDDQDQDKESLPIDKIDDVDDDDNDKMMEISTSSPPPPPPLSSNTISNVESSSILSNRPFPQNNSNSTQKSIKLTIRMNPRHHSSNDSTNHHGHYHSTNNLNCDIITKSNTQSSPTSMMMIEETTTTRIENYCGNGPIIYQFEISQIHSSIQSLLLNYLLTLSPHSQKTKITPLSKFY